MLSDTTDLRYLIEITGYERLFHEFWKYTTVRSFFLRKYDTEAEIPYTASCPRPEFLSVHDARHISRRASQSLTTKKDHFAQKTS